MLQSILEIRQLYHAQSHNWSQGNVLFKYILYVILFINLYFFQNKFREKDPNDIHQKTKVRLNTLNNG